MTFNRIVDALHAVHGRIPVRHAARRALEAALEISGLNSPKYIWRYIRASEEEVEQARGEAEPVARPQPVAQRHRCTGEHGVHARQGGGLRRVDREQTRVWVRGAQSRAGRPCR